MDYKRCGECDNDFSCFFHHATDEQKIELYKVIIREATEEQLRIINKEGLATP